MDTVPSRPVTTPLTRLIRTLVVAVVLISLSGCSIVQNFLPKSFDNVNQVKDELALDTLGVLQMEQENVADPFSDEKPTYIAIIAGDDAATTLETRLAEAEYNKVGQATWQKEIGGKVVTFQYNPVEPGDKVDLGGHRSVEAEETGVSIFIQD